MTYSWTLSYDVSLSQTTDGIAVFDGTGRSDVYFPGTNGVYSRNEFFNEGRLSNGVFTLTFSDTGRWEFNPIDASASAGKLSRSVDRNGNFLSFAYDTSGRLLQIVDDLGRTAPKVKPAVIDAILDQARKYNIPVTAHIYSLADTEHLVQAGAAGFLHMIQDTENIDPAFIARLRDLRIVFAPTLVRQELGWLYAEHPQRLDDPEVARTVDAGSVDEARQAARSSHVTQAERQDFERAMRNTRKLAAGGVLIGVGSDGGSALDFPGLMTHREVELLVEAGFSPMDAIVAATRNGGVALRKGDELGTVEPGRLADLMLVSGNPLEDVRNLRKIDRLMLNGEWVDREALKLK